jgi:hypothetical protein
LQTHLPPDECWRRLDTIADIHRWFFPWRWFRENKPLLANRKGDNLVLALRMSYNERYGHYFYGRIAPADGGSLIEGEFRMSRSSRVFLAFNLFGWGLPLAGSIIVDGGLGWPDGRFLHLFALIFVGVTAAMWEWDGRYGKNPIPPLLEMTFEAIRL